MKDHHQVPAGLEPVSYYTGAVEAFCEMVDGGLKPLALSAPLEPELASQVRVYVEQSIKKYDLVLYEEKDFPQTALTPRESVKGKIIFLLCRDHEVLKTYRLLKKKAADGMDVSGELRQLLGYPEKI